MVLQKGEHKYQQQQAINLFNFMPSDIQQPSIHEGETLLTITSCKIVSGSYGYNSGKEKIIIEFKNEEDVTFRQVFYKESGMVNFAKFISCIFGEEVLGEFDINSLIGVRIKAFIYHNYLSNGKGYANIGVCELYKSK
ncbi:hypothetical protein PD280_07375 [Virgibacillus salarius]|uniref:hypothetical protein n=1 Tax=Virgibacillus salarius TaxID=447199 RepID=UPI00249019A8|nr:hypothetical protein [Virgibacillus salarius]WBX81512.1 hypothetical protein PD280_07375 [Virgibacillus salarius]